MIFAECIAVAVVKFLAVANSYTNTYVCLSVCLSHFSGYCRLEVLLKISWNLQATFTLETEFYHFQAHLPSFKVTQAKYFVKRIKFGVPGPYMENACKEWPETLHAEAPWLYSEMNKFWSWSVDFSHFYNLCSVAPCQWPLTAKRCRCYYIRRSTCMFLIQNHYTDIYIHIYVYIYIHIYIFHAPHTPIGSRCSMYIQLHQLMRYNYLNIVGVFNSERLTYPA